MRKIAGPGAVGNAFVDYDAATNPNGTVHTADWGNDVQDELIALQDEFSIAEAAGSNAYILAAIKGAAIGFGKHVGELFFLDTVKDAVEFDKDDPETFFPAKCLDAVEGYEDLDVTNWPDLVPHLRAKVLTYFDGITGEKSSLDVTGWAIASNVATLTFANTTAENAILAALTEDQLIHGSYSNWRSITLPSAIGDITAGEYAITDVDAASRTIDFAFTASNNSGSGSFTVNFYENRIPGSTTTARLYEATARTLVSANDADGEEIAGLRRRDRFQAFQIGAEISATTYYGLLAGSGSQCDSSASPGNAVPRYRSAEQGNAAMLIAQDDGTNGTPRTGATTDPRMLVAHVYIHGRSYLVP